jgi:DedD protein
MEAVRQRARHRLIGASILVLVGVVGFSLLFDTQPRPIAVDIPIEIPAKAAPAAPAAGSSAASAENAGASAKKNEPAPEPALSEPVAAAPAPVQEAPAPVPADPPRVLAPAPAPAPASGASSSAKTAVPSAPSAPADTAGSNDGDSLRLVVQVGAFAEAARAREVRLKIEAAGMKTYTHVAETSEGRRIRVRLGPFSSRADADKAVARVKALGYPARILTL